ncbi:DNA gyrase inhibitor YacG [Derxia lacustris]|uniref:DNA gyrase inhibitor YacG n=1 Tax=Derxia lacustris TaxID=764842 RepID=UPI000A1772BC|nr:DNA gyrase inhibitor YacG [Derxia lacustris]
MTTEVKCPSCGRKVPWTDASRWRPFCSERCKKVDLGAWASDRYVIPGAPLDDTSSPGEKGSD